MTIWRARRVAAALLGLALMQGGAAQASILINTAQVGPDLVFSFSGTFNVSNLVNITSINDDQVVVPTTGAILFSGTGQLAGYRMVDKFPSFGAVDAFGTATGDIFKVYSDDPTILGFAPGYAGGLISGSLTIANSTFADLGLITGTYTTTASNGDFVQLDIFPASAVPLPAALPLFAAGLGAVGLLLRRKRKRHHCVRDQTAS